MGTIILHQSEASPLCDKVRRILHYKRRRYETREVAATDALVRLRRPDVVGEVPIIEHGERVIADSSEIARYLDEVYPDPPLYPTDPREAALCHLLEDWADESLYFYALWLRFGLTRNAPEWSRRKTESEPPGVMRRVTERALPTLMRNVLKSQGIGRREPEKVLEQLDRHLASLDVWLEGDHRWLVGDRITVADIAVYAQLACAGETGDGAALLSDHPRVLGWMERVNAATAPF